MLSDEASKLHKSLDLTIYLDYLRHLFAQSTSDSDSSDSESQPIHYEVVHPSSSSQGNNPTPTSTPPNPPPNDTPSSSRSSSKSNFNFTPSTNSNGEDESSPSVHTTKSTTSSGTANSDTASENSTDGENDCADLDLPPISDLELNNIFLDHKLWKKSPEPAPDFLIVPPEFKVEKQEVFPSSGGIGSGQSSSSPQFLQSINDGILASVNDEVNQPNVKHVLMDGEDDDDEDGQDDNDSLSDYMNMTANSALVLDPYFKYESDCMTPSSVTPIAGLMANIHINDIRKQHKAMSKSGGGLSLASVHLSSSKNKKVSEQKKAKTIESMNIKRRRLYILLCKKEIGKTQRARANSHKEMLIIKRRLALACNRHFKKKVIQSQKAMKESIWRAKRHSREMQAYWKQADRIEREVRKRREKEAEEQRKIDMDLMEAKLQQSKLNFLITQAELFAHLMAKKLPGLSPSPTHTEKDILSQLEQEPKVSSDSLDTDKSALKNLVSRNVDNAYQIQQTQTELFALDSTSNHIQISSAQGESEIPQPGAFSGTLKQYQLKGMNWLINLFNNGMSGILADDTGLGKTVQAIALLAHVAEKCDVSGPFLVIAPMSKLQNWQHEFQSFVPHFKVVPYWGNPQERKALRQTWQFSNLNLQKGNFHVVLTSYQIIIADLNYFNRVKWQCLVFDEAQAIKSTSSARWKSLFDLSCRCRLLLVGIQIHNTFGVLWSLLHFIMPSLFDSQDEFAEWFCKDAESQSENKCTLDEKNLSRLLIILEPFILRRIKRDVEHELVEKVEVQVDCPLTPNQWMRYAALKKKIRVEDLLRSSCCTNSQLLQYATTNLMNLVTQFRKVCNHPSLFDRHKVSSPFYMPRLPLIYPKLITRDSVLPLNLRQGPMTALWIYQPKNIAESINSLKTLPEPPDDFEMNSEWSFSRFIGLSPAELNATVISDLLDRWNSVLVMNSKLEVVFQQRCWRHDELKESARMGRNDLLLTIETPLSTIYQKGSPVMQDLVFVSCICSAYTFLSEKIISTPETIEHRKLRSRKKGLQGSALVEALVHKPKDPEIRQLCPVEMPHFLSDFCPKVISRGQINLLALANRWRNFLNDMYTKPLTGSISVVNKMTSVEPLYPTNGWSNLIVSDREKLVTESGKLRVLDDLLKKLKAEGHRVLIYSHMSKMIDLLEEYMWHRKWTYRRLDAFAEASTRKEMIADFQSMPDIFVFLLSPRVGGRGINLTAADTVIFYDSDWNPTIYDQAVDRTHRLGQTKPVTVYLLICKGTIEEKILQRAKEKRKVEDVKKIGEGCRTDTLKPAEVVCLILDDEHLEKRYLQRKSERHSPDEPIFEPENELSSSNIKRKAVINSYEVTVPFNFRSAIVLNAETFDDRISVSKKSKFDDIVEAMQGPSSSYLNEISNLQLHDAHELLAEEKCTEIMEEVYSSNEEFEGDLDEFDVDDYDTVDGGACSKALSSNESVSDLEDEFGSMPRRKLGRGSGKRGRPPLRVRTVFREIDGDSPFRRGPGRPRIKPIGPANQGIRGRGPGRPPLSRKPENLSTNVPLTTSQKVFGFYSSLDLDPA